MYRRLVGIGAVTVLKHRILSRNCLFLFVPHYRKVISDNSNLANVNLSSYAIQRRFQSSVTEKKYHCSICKKGFRLEMAAKVHIQQAHNGDGNVEIGTGPGQESDTTTLSRATVPPKAPVRVQEIATQEKRGKKGRPAPKPLHAPDREIPQDSMEELLQVWDTVGVKRLGTHFVHSSMIMKVFAAKPSDVDDVLYEKLILKGSSPFKTSQKCTFSSALTATDYRNFFLVFSSYPFVVPSADYLSPFYPGCMTSPFLVSRNLPQYKSDSKEILQEANDGSAPITPFGQLPLFGQELQAKDKGLNVVQATVVSPLTNNADSPFSRGVDAPLSSTPFSSDGSGIPGTASSPFCVGEGTPFGTADSPFGSESLSEHAEAASCFREEPVRIEAEEPFKCKTCAKNFNSFMALRMHSKAKHAVSIPIPPYLSKRATEIPAYIPSPVNLSMTSPFSTVVSTASWPEAEINVFTHAVSNLTAAGDVCAVEEIGLDASQVILSLSEGGTRTTLKVQCFGFFHQVVQTTLKKNDKVFVCGSLRLFPLYEPANKKYYSCPIVHVAQPTGTIAKI